MSSTILVLKQIIDLLYEEQQHSEVYILKKKIEDLENNLVLKNKEIAELYTTNAELENTIRQYENDFELLTSLTKNIPKDVSGNDSSGTDVSGINTVEEDVSENKEDFVDDTEEGKSQRKRKRKEYMREYQREYRKRQREGVKMSMNL